VRRFSRTAASSLHIVAMTFTNKAARGETKERSPAQGPISGLVGVDLPQPGHEHHPREYAALGYKPFRSDEGDIKRSDIMQKRGRRCRDKRHIGIGRTN
jgi:hypothetical protein